MSKKFALRGLVAATFTPMHADGSLNLAMAGPMIERLLAGKVSAAFACGTTGECASLTSEERRQTLCAFIDAAAGRMPVIAHVGHSALADSCELAAHAQAVGAAAVATTPPYYFRPDSVDALVECRKGPVQMAMQTNQTLASDLAFALSDAVNCCYRLERHLPLYEG